MVDQDDRVRPQPPTTSNQPLLILAIAIVAIGLLIAVAIVLVGAWRNGTGNNSKTDTGSMPSSPTVAQTSAPNTDCPGLSVTYLDPHVGQDVITGGIPKDPAESKPFVLDKSSDPSVFAWYYNDSPLVKVLHRPTITDPWSLVTEAHKLGACWTTEGQKLHNEWSLLWSMVDGVPAPLPANGSNGSVSANGAPAQSVGPIPAGTATEFTYRDATGQPSSKSRLRNECGNPVNESVVPGIPSLQYVSPPVTEILQPPPPVWVQPPPVWVQPPPEWTPPPTLVPPPPPPPTTWVPPPPPPPTTWTPPPPPPPPPPTLAPKVATEIPPAPQGGGTNDQPGPGTYIPPAQMVQPPATAYVPPPPPVVTGPSAPIRLPAPVTAPPVQQGAMPPPVVIGTTVVQAPPMTSVMPKPN